MDQKPNEAEKPILVDKIIKEIKKTGFPLELHVLDVCSTRNTGRMPNVRYMYDGILREVDLYAFFETMIIERKKKRENFQYTSTSMIIECKKSDAKPWVFFSSPIHRDSDIFYYTKYLSDFDLHFRANAKGLPLIGQIRDQVRKNHYRDKTAPRCLTYFECFKSPSGSSEIYKAVDSVLSFLCYQRGLKRREADGVSTNFFYPIVVLDGFLCEAIIDRDSIAVKEQQYVQLRTDYKSEIFIVDVLTKEYFRKFFARVEQDHEQFVKAINGIRFPRAHQIAVKKKLIRELKEMNDGFPVDYFFADNNIR